MNTPFDEGDRDGGLVPEEPPPVTEEAAYGAESPPPPPAYPVRFETDYQEPLSRLSTFFRLLLAIPLLIVVAILGGGAGALGVGAGLVGTLFVVHWITVLVRGRPVRWVFDSIVAVQRFTYRADTYFLLMTDRYPPFEGDWSARYEVDCPERVSRWKLLFWKTLTSIPHFVALAVFGIFVGVLVIISWFAILFAGRFPKGLHEYVSGWVRWYARVSAYWASLTDEFPPYSFAADAGPGKKQSEMLSAVAGVAVTIAAIAGVAALIAVPGKSDEVQVSYESLLDGRSSETAEVGGVLVTAGFAVDPYVFPDDLYRAEEGERFLLFYLEIDNSRDWGFRVSEGDFHLEDTDGDGHDPFLVTLAGMKPPKTLEGESIGDAVVMFEVPEGADPAVLTYSPQFGFKPKVRFELR